MVAAHQAQLSADKATKCSWMMHEQGWRAGPSSAGLEPLPPPAGPPPGFVPGHLPPPSGPPPSMSMHRLPPPMMPPPGYAVLMPPPPGNPSHDLSAIACLSPCCHLCLAPFCRAGHVFCTTFLKRVYVSDAAIDTVMPVVLELGLEVCMHLSRYNRG